MNKEVPVPTRSHVQLPWPRRRWGLAYLALAVLATAGVALVGCGAAAPTRADVNPPPSQTGQTPPVIFRPTGLSSTRKPPMVVALHASGGTATSFETVSGLDAVAQRHGFVVAYLGGNWALSLLSSNLAYIKSEIKSLINSQNIDPQRVYVTGFSAGASMTFVVGCQFSSLIAGIAPVSGAMRFSDPPCRPKPESELLVIGSNDVIPFGGSSRLLSASSEEARWRKADKCTRSSRAGASGPVTEQTWSHCKGRVAVGLYVVQGGNHQWPGNPSATGPDAQFNAASAVWAFFAAHPRGK